MDSNFVWGFSCQAVVLDGIVFSVRNSVVTEPRFRGNRLRASFGPRFCGDDGLTETVDYCAAARIGMCAFKKRRTRSIVRCLSSSGSFHG